MKVVSIIPYFGNFPNYFDLFLKSCKNNKEFTWFIFTDNKESYDYPDNVKKIPMTFDECKKLVKSKFDFDISLDNYKKLCDYKVAYGYIFEEYITDFDFWGYCDVDLIWGNLSKFITEDILKKYDKIYSLGHLTLYRNTFENNRVFMRKLNGKLRYKEVFTSPQGFAFDEWYPESVNDIYLQEKLPFLVDCPCADIFPYKSSFVLDYYNLETRAYHNDDVKNNVFKCENGEVNRYFIQNKILNKVEHPYVHLQKRKMKKFISDDTESFYIIPNKFVNTNKSEEEMLKISSLSAPLNFQYFKVKYSSLKVRLKNNDWSGFINRKLKRD